MDEGQGTIVVVEDDHNIADLLELYLRREGYRVVQAETGADGRASKVTFTLDAGVIKDDYTLAYTWQGDDRVDWTLVKSKALKSQVGAYILSESGGTTDVTYQLAVDLNIPMLGMFKRKAEKVIIDTALKGLKKRVESGA